MANLFDTVFKLLKEDNRFVAEDGSFLRNAAYEAAMKMDEKLLHMLLNNTETKKHFFKDVDGITIFDKVEFGWLLNNKEFMPDSYTRFKNKIGLAVKGTDRLLSSQNDVELVFPYKDCVLEGGQTKEDQKRNEIFFNEILAPNEVDRLLSPKVMVNAKRYSVSGECVVTSISKTDNLLVKGNNLLVLTSLKKKYSNKVRMAYWDVPYNTGSDSFKYNDKFSRSSWLLFIKNRIEKVLPLIKNEGGVLLVQCSYHQYAYLKVLLDEIIGNYVMTFNVLARHPDRTLASDKEFNDVVEYVLVYSKSSSFKMPKIGEEKTVDDYQYMVEEIGEGISIDFDGRKAKMFTPDKYVIKKVEPAKENLKIITVRGSIKEKNSSGRFYVKYLQPLEGKYPDKTLFKVDGIGDDIYDYRYFYLPPTGKKNGAYLQGMPLSSSITYKPYPNFLEFVQSYNTVNDEGVVEFRNGKKPEDLIAYFMDIFTVEGDIVLDAFAGSATTASVAVKMNRQFVTSEQMDYIHTITIPRICGVINGEENDLLSEIGYTGGGSFVYCELAKLNQKEVDEIEVAQDTEALLTIWERMKSTGFISCKVKPSDIDENIQDFKELSLDNQKRFLMEVLDKNLLYVNYTDMDDAEFGISDADKAFTRSFYGEE